MILQILIVLTALAAVVFGVPWLFTVAGYAALILLGVGILKGALNVGGMVVSAGILLGGLLAEGWWGVLGGAILVHGTTVIGDVIFGAGFAALRIRRFLRRFEKHTVPCRGCGTLIAQSLVKRGATKCSSCCASCQGGSCSLHGY